MDEVTSTSLAIHSSQTYYLVHISNQLNVTNDPTKRINSIINDTRLKNKQLILQGVINHAANQNTIEGI